jgi:predicted DNA-binding protein (MmcQ/YjbR family)
MGRFHWVTIVNVDHFPPAYLAELVEWSYHKALGSLSKAGQRAIPGA